MQTWKDIPGFEGAYQASDDGFIRSLDRAVRCNTGTRLVPGQILKTKIIKGGYQVVTLSAERRAVTRTVHSLVALTFIGPRPPGLDCCHNDGKTLNCAAGNLRYDTRLANHADKARHGTMARGEKINTSRLTEEKVVEIRQRRADGEKLQSLADSFGISTTAVSLICVGDHWRHVGGPRVERQQRRTA